MVATAKKAKPKGKTSIGKLIKSVKQKIDLIGRPKYSEMIKYAIGSLKERHGSSRQAILKFILEFYDVGHDKRAVNNYLKQALRAGVKNGKLKQIKGTGASGSFRIGDLNDKMKPNPTNVSVKPGIKKKVLETKKAKKGKPDKPTKKTTKKKWTATKTAKGKQPPKKTKAKDNKTPKQRKKPKQTKKEMKY